MTSGDFTETVGFLKTMETRRVITFIYFLFGFSECVRQCVNQRCERRRGPGRGPGRGSGERQSECRIVNLPDDFTIVSIELVEYDRRARDRCVLDETYRISGSSIQVSGMCRGEFQVCFETDSDDDVTSNGPTTMKPSTTAGATSMTRTTNEEDTTVIVDVFGNTSLSNDGITSPNSTFIQTNVSIAIPDTQQKNHFIKMAGILGAVVGVLTFLVLSITVVVIQQKRLSCLKIRYKRREPGRRNQHRNVSSTASAITTVSNDDRYDSLQSHRNSHTYQQFKTEEPIHNYMTVYDTYDDSATLTQDKSCAIAEERNKTNVSYDYVAVQDEFNITANKLSSPTDSFQQTPYTVLDPMETGFSKGIPMTLNYELAKPIDLTVSESNRDDLELPIMTNERDENEKALSKLARLTTDSAKTLNKEAHSRDIYYDSNLGMYNMPCHDRHGIQDHAVNIYNHVEDLTYVTPRQSNVSDVMIGHYDFTRASVNTKKVAENYDHIL